MNLSQDDFKLSLQRVLARYHSAIALILFAVGIVVRILAQYLGGAVSPIASDLGTFLAGTIAISFIYDRLFRAEDRQLFLSDLEEVLGEKLSSLENGKTGLRIYEMGRMPVHEKVTFFQNAKTEVIEFGISLSTFVGFFEQRPAHEYKKPVFDLLRKGVTFKCLVLDPDSEVAKTYASDRGEIDLTYKIRRSIQMLIKLRDEFQAAGCVGGLTIYKYDHFPYCYVLLVDPLESDGRAYISHYMHATSRADTPILEVHKSSHPALFEKYAQMVGQLLTESTKL